MHAAAFTGTRPDIEVERSRSIVGINSVGTVNLLGLACGLSLERFLYVSSAAVYGESHSPGDALREDTDLRPHNLYAATKYAGELLTRRYGEIHGFEAVSVRLTSPYGPMERVTRHRAMMSMLYQWSGNVVRGEPMRVGDRTLGRDYTYVSDSAAGVSTVLDAPSMTYDVYNISSGRWTTVEEIIKVLRGLRPSVQVVDDPGKEFGMVGPSAVPRVMDMTRIQQDLGFTTSFDLAAGLRYYLQWRDESPFRD